MKLVRSLEAFLRDSVNINQSRLALLDEHVKAIGNFLGSHRDIGPLYVGLIPQGSWSHKTIIRPVGDATFDADVLLELEPPDEWKPRDYVSKLKAVFKSSGLYADKVLSKNRCVRIEYSGDHHVDVVPYVVLAGQGQITNSELNLFEPTDPQGFSNWMRSRDAITHGNLRKATRFVKYIRDYKETFSVRSVILTTLL